MGWNKGPLGWILNFHDRNANGKIFIATFHSVANKSLATFLVDVLFFPDGKIKLHVSENLRFYANWLSCEGGFIVWCIYDGLYLCGQCTWQNCAHNGYIYDIEKTNRSFACAIWALPNAFFGWLTQVALLQFHGSTSSSSTKKKIKKSCTF